MKKMDIITACSDLGVNIDGAKLGPERILQLLNKDNYHEIKKVIPTIFYQKNNDKKNKMKNLKEINLFNQDLYLEIKNSLKNNYFPITLGGDHSIAIASALASIEKYKNLGIIWFDAHGDFNTFKSTPSGNIHGLPLAAITNYEKKYLTSFHYGNYYSPKNTVILGARDIDLPYELENLKDAGVTIISTQEIKKYGMESMAKKAIEIASYKTNGIHISYDLDVIDPLLAPGVSVPVEKGLNIEDSNSFLKVLFQNKEKIKSFDLVEFNPLYDKEQKTEKIAFDILNQINNNLK